MTYDARKDHYEGWRPYCLVCSSMFKMNTMSFGWMCGACGNTIGFDLKHRYLPGKDRHCPNCRQEYSEGDRCPMCYVTLIIQESPTSSDASSPSPKQS